MPFLNTTFDIFVNLLICYTRTQWCHVGYVILIVPIRHTGQGSLMLLLLLCHCWDGGLFVMLLFY